MQQRISLITLGVTDLAKAIAFYENVLGWKKSPGPPEIAFFDLNGLVFGLWPHEHLAKDFGSSPHLNAYHGFALAHNVGSVDEVNAIFAHLKQAGVVTTKEPAAQFWGGYSGYFADPDGHQWEIAYNPFWTIHSDGRVSTTS